MNPRHIQAYAEYRLASLRTSAAAGRLAQPPGTPLRTSVARVLRACAARLDGRTRRPSVPGAIASESMA